MKKKSVLLDIARWLVKFNIPNKFSEFDYPGKIDAFYFRDYNNNDDIDIIMDYHVVSNKQLDIDKDFQKLYYDEDNGFFPYEVYRTKNNNYVWMQYGTDKNPSIAFKIKHNWKSLNLIYDITNTNGNYAFEYCAKLFSYTALELGGIVLHGVLMEYNNKGIIISAPSGTGKTTHARMWRNKERALIINGDRALCRKIDNIWIGFGMPWCGTSGEYINRSIAISAIVVLEQSEENSVEKLETLDAFNYMMPNITAPTWEKNLLNKAMDYLEDLITEIPVYKLKCCPDLEAVDILKKEIDKL